MHFSAVILAGGKSSRMGQDKAWLEVNGQPLIRRQIQLARDAGAVEVFISGRAAGDYSVLGCPVLHDAFPDAGPLAGIERALHASASEVVFVLAVDLPRLTPSLMRDLLARCQRQTGIVPRVNGRIEPLVALYPRAAHRIAADQLAARHFAVRDFAAACVRKQLATFADLPAEAAGMFRNWNAPSDLMEN